VYRIISSVIVVVVVVGFAVIQMELQYYIQYIITWFYHNVIYTDATYAILKIGLMIGLVSFLVYRQYALFLLLCIVILILEGYRWMKETNRDFGELQKLVAETVAGVGSGAGSGTGVVNRDDLTTGVSISSREGFSLGMPTIIRGDDSGKDHRRSNKFVEHDSNEFTDKYFKSKQCSIGSGIGGITMFGSNELIGSSRTASMNRIYDFEGKVILAHQNDNKRYEYFRDCVYGPVSRSINTGKDFRAIKKDILEKVNAYIINIERCLKRFNTSILFNTVSDVSADRSKSLTLSGTTTPLDTSSKAAPDAKVAYLSLIAGADNSDKMKNILGLDKGDNADNADIGEYSKLLKFTSDKYKNDIKTKELYLAVYGKVFRYRKRIDEILAMMFEQSKNDELAMNTIRVSEPIIKELRMILGYLAIIQRTKDIIGFEEKQNIYSDGEKIGNGKLLAFNASDTDTNKIIEGIIKGDTNILKLPHDDDTYNSTDEKRYLYGITYYFGGRPHRSPPS
jgi:hypothetical protein